MKFFVLGNAHCDVYMIRDGKSYLYDEAYQSWKPSSFFGPDFIEWDQSFIPTTLQDLNAVGIFVTKDNVEVK